MTRLGPLRPVLAAFAFLTRLPVPGGPFLDREVGRSLAFFPLVGLLLGLAASGVAALGGGVLPSLVLAVLLAALLAVLTGGLHLDGVADLFDALGGGRGDRARMLEIMRDSRIGAHGTAALVFVVLAKVAALEPAVARGDLVALLAFPVIARWAAAPLVVLYPYARPEGLGRAFAGEARAVQLLGATALLGLVVAGAGTRLLVPALGAGAVALGLGFWLTRKLGGLTGDVYGAAIEIAEVTALVLADVIR
jgi:adenosylcobinamide-GDP ribazoletransferase